VGAGATIIGGAVVVSVVELTGVGDGVLLMQPDNMPAPPRSESPSAKRVAALLFIIVILLLVFKARLWWWNEPLWSAAAAEPSRSLSMSRNPHRLVFHKWFAGTMICCHNHHRIAWMWWCSTYPVPGL
jgi:hypothetical protein